MKRIPDCHPDREHKCRGMCSPCYQRYKASAEFKAVGRKAKSPTCGHGGKVVGRGLCSKCYSRWLRERDGEEGRMKRRSDRLISTYGITHDEFLSMRNAQDDRCAICLRPFGEDKHVHVDHCHETNRVRGLLCFSCNKALGMLGDNPCAIQRALAYVSGAPILMRKLDGKAAERCGLPEGTPTPKGIIKMGIGVGP